MIRSSPSDASWLTGSNFSCLQGNKILPDREVQPNIPISMGNKATGDKDYDCRKKHVYFCHNRNLINDDTEFDAPIRIYICISWYIFQQWQVDSLSMNFEQLRIPYPGACWITYWSRFDTLNNQRRPFAPVKNCQNSWPWLVRAKVEFKSIKTSEKL